MTAQLGVILLFLAFLCAAYAWGASFLGGRREDDRLVESARNAAIMTWPLLTAAALTLISLLVRGEFNTTFVWTVTDRAMPTYLKVTALWGGQAGSLLFWSWLMSTFTAAAMLRNWKRERHLMPYVISAAMGTLTFFIVLVAFWENPFARYWQTLGGDVATAMFGPSAFFTPLGVAWGSLAQKIPGLLGIVAKGMVPLTAPLGATAVFPPDGNGLNPLLRHPGMIIHPPMLYLGFVSFVVPYAFGMAALARGEVSDSWIRATRRWTLVGWLFLSLGLILGGWWAYDVLGWGGYWAWDPVENAAFMPWLTGTAFLHSVMIQEKRGMLRRWNMVLITLTYLQVVLGTFATRSGFVSSVHSFAQSAIGPLFSIFLGGALIVSVSLLIKRWDEMAADNELDSLFSRETFFLINNLLFLCINVAVAVGTYWPVFTELLQGVVPGVQKSSLGEGFFNATTGPMFMALIFLMGVTPLIAWKHASLKRVARAMLWPSVIALAILGAVTAIMGVRGLLPAGRVVVLTLIGYGVALDAGSLTIGEYYRGVRARMVTHGENFFAALGTMVGRNRRRYGGYLIHLGVVIMAIGVIASHVFQKETQQAVSSGQTITMGDYVLEYKNLERFMASDGRAVTRAQAVVYQNGREVAQLSPRIDSYPGGQPMSIPGKYTSFMGDDFYVLLVTWEPLSLSNATFKIYYNPLVNWVWMGGFVFIFGTLVAAWPDFSEERRSVPAKSRRATPLAAAGK